MSEGDEEGGWVGKGEVGKEGDMRVGSMKYGHGVSIFRGGIKDGTWCDE